MPDTSELSVELLADGAQLFATLDKAEEAVQSYARVIQEAGGKVAAGLDSALTPVTGMAKSLSRALARVAKSMDVLAGSSRAAAANVSAASGDMADAVVNSSQAQTAAVRASQMEQSGLVNAGAKERVAAQAQETSAALSVQERRLQQFEAMGIRITQMEMQQQAAQTRAQEAGIRARESAVMQQTQWEIRQQEIQDAAAERSAIAQGRAQKRLDETTHRKRLKTAHTVGDGLLIGGGVTLAGLAGLTYEASKYQSAILDAANNTQMTTADINQMKAAVLKMGEETGAPLDGLANSFMRAANHGYDMADSMKIVAAASTSAIATNSDVEQTANVLSQTMHIFHLSGDQAMRTMATLHAAANLGNMSAQDFVDNFGEAEAVAAGFGLKLQDVAATFSALTQNGLNAAISGTQLRDVIQHIVNPSKSAAAELKRLSRASGVDLVGDFSAAGLKSKGLTGILSDLARATHGNATEIERLIPAQRGSFGAIVVTQKGAKDLTNAYRSLGDTTANIARLDRQAAERKQTLANQMARLNNTFIEMAVNVGPTLLPVMGKIADDLKKLLDGFNSLPQPVQNAIVKFLLYGGIIASVTGLFVKLITGVIEFRDLLVGSRLAMGLTNWISGLKGAGAAAVETEGEVAAAGVASTDAAAAGAVAFAAGGPFMLAIAAVAIALGGLVYWWNQIKDAQDRAAQSAARYASMQTAVSSQNERGADEVEIQKVATALSGRQTALKAYQTELKTGGNAAAGTAWVSRGELKRNIQQAKSDISGLEAAYAKLKNRLHQIDTAQIDQATVSTTGSDAVGAAIAQSASSGKDNLGAFKGLCQKLARERVERATSAFDKYFAATALETLHNFQQAGLAHPYSPGMALPAGSLLYSDTMGHGDGHVQIVGNGGHRYDQHGTDHFGLTNFQYYVPPPGMGGAPVASSGGMTEAQIDAYLKRTAVGSSKTRRASIGSLAPVDLKPSPVVLPEDVSKLAANANTYAAKLAALDDALATHDALQQASGHAYDTYAAKHIALTKRILLANETLYNVDKALGSLAPGVKSADTARRAAGAAVNRDAEQLKSIQQRGGKISPEEATQYAALRAHYKSLQESYAADSAALKRNEAVQKQANAQQAADTERLTALEVAQSQKRVEQYLKEQAILLKNGSLTRLQYEANLTAAAAGKNKSLGALDPADAARLTDMAASSAATRTQATHELTLESLRLNHHDFAALRMELADEVAQRRAAGVAENAIEAYAAARNKQITADEFAFKEQQAKQMQSDLMNIDQETEQQYKGFLLSEVAAVSAQYGANSLELAKLKYAIAQIDWKTATDAADGYRRSLEDGDISLQQYVTSLQGLETTLPTTSAAFKGIADSISQADKRMASDAESHAGHVASSFTNAFMQVATRAKTMNHVVQDALLKARDAFVKQELGSAIKGLVMKMRRHAAPVKTSPQQIVQMQQVATNQFGQHVMVMQNAVNQFGQTVNRLLAGPSGGTAGNTPPAAGAAGHSGAATVTVSGGSATGGGTLNTVSAGVGAVQAARSGNILGAISQGAGLLHGSLAKTIGSAVPYVGMALSLASMFGGGGGGLFGGGWDGAFKTFHGKQHSAHINTNTNPNANSGYSGASGMNSLMQPQGVHFHPGSIQVSVQGLDPSSVKQTAAILADEVQKQIAARTAVDNAARGTS